MPWAVAGGALAAAGAIGSSLISSDATSSATNAQTAAAGNATAAQLAMFQQTQNNLAPYMASGSNALATLNSQLGLTAAAPAGATGTTGMPATQPWTTTSGYGPTSGSFTPNTTATYSGDASSAISQMYQNLLGRAPDTAGLAYWIGQANKGVPLSQIASQIQASPEFTQDASKIGAAGAGTTSAAGATGATVPGTGVPPTGSPLALPTYGSTINGIAGPQNYGAAQYQQSPGYQWQLSQGLGAISNAASAQGGIQSGNTLKALQTYGQGLANQDFQQGYSNYLNNYQNAYSGNVANANTNFSRLYDLAGSGQNAAASLGGFSRDTAAQVGSNILGAGNATSAGAIAQGSTYSNLLNSLTAGTQSSPSTLQQIYSGLFNNGGNGGVYALSPNELNPGGYGG